MGKHKKPQANLGSSLEAVDKQIRPTNDDRNDNGKGPRSIEVVRAQNHISKTANITDTIFNKKGDNT